MESTRPVVLEHGEQVDIAANGVSDADLLDASVEVTYRAEGDQGSTTGTVQRELTGGRRRGLTEYRTQGRPAR